MSFAICLTYAFIAYNQATSALDATSDYCINQELKTMMKGQTVISIEHRLSTIGGAVPVIVPVPISTIMHPRPDGTMVTSPASSVVTKDIDPTQCPGGAVVTKNISSTNQKKGKNKVPGDKSTLSHTIRDLCHHHLDVNICGGSESDVDLHQKVSYPIVQ